MRERTRSLLRAAATLIVTAAVYEAVARSGVFPKALLPTLPTVAGRLVDMLADGTMLWHAGYTLGRDREKARLIALCDALSHAHAQGVVHRDVKPSNILVAEQPATPAQVAKLTDFGVARVIGGTTLTRTGDVVGTAAYMAPEQAEGLEAGAAADLYSLALVTYEALTGINPVRTTTAAQRARRLGAYLPPLRRQRRDLLTALQVVLGPGVLRADAARSRHRRRPSTVHMRRLLPSAAGGQAPQHANGQAPRPRQAPRETIFACYAHATLGWNLGLLHVQVCCSCATVPGKSLTAS